MESTNFTAENFAASPYITQSTRPPWGLTMVLVYSSAPSPATNAPQPRPPRLLDCLRFALRAKHYAYRTEQAYVHWVRRYILHHGKRHPEEMGGPEIEAFLTHLAVAAGVSASTQTQQFPLSQKGREIGRSAAWLS